MRKPVTLQSDKSVGYASCHFAACLTCTQLSGPCTLSTVHTTISEAQAPYRLPIALKRSLSNIDTHGLPLTAWEKAHGLKWYSHSRYCITDGIHLQSAPRASRASRFVNHVESRWLLTARNVRTVTL